MAINKYHFRWMYVHDFKTTVDYFAKILNKKVIPGFDDLSEEADAVEREAYERLGMSFDPENEEKKRGQATFLPAFVACPRLRSME